MTRQDDSDGTELSMDMLDGAVGGCGKSHTHDKGGNKPVELKFDGKVDALPELFAKAFAEAFKQKGPTSKEIVGKLVNGDATADEDGKELLPALL